jgi:hypothetical protein
MHINRGLLFWGLALITAGLVALAAMQGMVDRTALSGAWRLWPVVLIAIGLAIVLSRTPFAAVGTVIAALVVGIAGGAVIAVGPGIVSCGGEPGATHTARGDFTRQVQEGVRFWRTAAAVDLELSCGSLDVTMADGTSWEAITSTNEDEDGVPVVEAASGSLGLSSGSEGFPFSRDRQEWALSLGREVAYDLSASLNAAESTLNLAGGTFGSLSLNPNAGSLDLDLSGARVADLDVSLNAGSVSIVADAGTDLAGAIGSNAGSIDFCTPAGTALRFTVDANLTFSHDLDESGLVQSGDTFTSPGFETAEHQIDLRLEGNAASFNLNPEEGCE